MTVHPLARGWAAAAVALVAMLLAAPTAAPGNSRGSLDGPKNLRGTASPPHGPPAAPGNSRGSLDGPKSLRVTAITPHGVSLAWDGAANSGSFTYVTDASYG